MPTFHPKLKAKPKVKGLGKKKKLVIPPLAEVGGGDSIAPFKGKWRPEMAFRLYELLKGGLSVTAAAQVMGVRGETALAWVEKIPLAKAAKAAALAQRDAEKETFAEYVYKRLPEDLHEAWKEIEEAGNHPNPVQRIEAALRGKGKRGRQYLFVHALVSNNFNVSEASRIVNVDRKTFQIWMKNDEAFGRIIDEIYESRKDLIEGELFRKIKEGDTSAILFASRTLNKDRGYGDSKTIKVDQTTTHRHMIDIDELDLSLEVRKAILEAIRRKSSPEALTQPVDVRPLPALPAARLPVEVYDYDEGSEE